MNNNINLCEILKGHEGEIFYNPLIGDIIFTEARDGLVLFEYGHSLISLPYTGFNLDGNLDIFPSQNQRDWEEWDKENNHKTSKTWSEYKKHCRVYNDDLSIDLTGHNYDGYTRRDTPIEKSALALLKIQSTN